MKLKNTLKKEQEFYNEHKNEYREKYLGKRILIYKNELKGAFDNFTDAYNFALLNKFTPNKFMIKKVTKEDKIVRITSVRL